MILKGFYFLHALEGLLCIKVPIHCYVKAPLAQGSGSPTSLVVDPNPLSPQVSYQVCNRDREPDKGPPDHHILRTLERALSGRINLCYWGLIRNIIA